METECKWQEWRKKGRDVVETKNNKGRVSKASKDGHNLDNY